MVDLDSNPTKLIEIVEIGKQLLMTRGSLTTFSIANDVAKYFAIIPAMLMATFPAIAPLNIMKLASPQSAILSAIIFNALIIVALIPLALRGVKYKPIGALAILQRNLLIYGLGGVIIPFLGIKAIDVIITDAETGLNHERVIELRRTLTPALSPEESGEAFAALARQNLRLDLPDALTNKPKRPPAVPSPGERVRVRAVVKTHFPNNAYEKSPL